MEITANTWHGFSLYGFKKDIYEFKDLWNENWEKFSFCFTILKKLQLCDNILTDKGPER